MNPRSSARSSASNNGKPNAVSATDQAAKATDAKPGKSPELTIDQLAMKSGVTVRNIRAHQSRGLLPAPTVRGRIGYYDDRHLARLELIGQLQAGGFNLTAIQRLVERAEQTGDDIGNLRNLVLMPFGDEQSEVLTLRELAEQLGSEIDTRILRKAIEMGFIVPMDDDRLEIVSPTILRAGAACIKLGIELDTLFDVIKTVSTHSRVIADAFTKMVDHGIVRPVEREGLPAESFPRVIAAVEALRPLAAEVMMAAFRINMDDAAEEAFGKILGRIAKEDLTLPTGDNDSADQTKKRSGRRGRSGSKSSKPR